jgi:hypothetical protein
MMLRSHPNIYIQHGALHAEGLDCKICGGTTNGWPQTTVTDVVLLPSISSLTKRVLYRTYDVTALLRRGSENAVGIWASAAWATYSDMDVDNLDKIAPLIRAELRIGNATVAATNKDWRWKTS